MLFWSAEHLRAPLAMLRPQLASSPSIVLDELLEVGGGADAPPLKDRQWRMSAGAQPLGGNAGKYASIAQPWHGGMDVEDAERDRSPRRRSITLIRSAVAQSCSLAVAA